MMHFDGISKKRTNVSLRGKSREEEKADLLRRARQEREARAADKEKRVAGLTILRFYRRRSSLHKMKLQCKAEFDKRITDLWNLRTLLIAAKRPLPTPKAVMESLVHQLIFFYDARQDVGRLERLVSILLDSCKSTNAEWNYMSLRESQSRVLETEVVRLSRLCLAQISEDDGNHQNLFLEMLEVLLQFPPQDASPQEHLVAWRVLLSLAVESSYCDIHEPMPKSTISRYQAQLRRNMGLPSALHYQMRRQASSRALSVLWRLALLAGGFTLARPVLDQSVEKEMRWQQRHAAGQIARAILSTPKLLSNASLVTLLSPLRQHRVKGLIQVLEAWDGWVQMRSLPSTASSELLPAPEVLIIVQNLLDLCRLALEEGDLDAEGGRHVAPLVRILEFSVRRVPLNCFAAGSSLPGAKEMEVDEEGDELIGEGGPYQETLEEAIGSAMKSSAYVSTRTTMQVVAAAEGMVLAESAQRALKELCGGRDLPRLFDRLLTRLEQHRQQDVVVVAARPEGEDEDDPVLLLCALCSYVLVHSQESLPAEVSVSTSSGATSGLYSQILNLLAYHAMGEPFVQRLWDHLGEKLADWSRTTTTTTGGTTSTSSSAVAVKDALLKRDHHALHLLFSVYSHQLMALDDEEFYVRQYPLSLTRVVSLVELIKSLLFQFYWLDPLRFGGSGGGGSNLQGASIPALEYLQLMRSSTILFNQLYQRHTRRPFPRAATASSEDMSSSSVVVVKESLWHWPAIPAHELDQETAVNDGSTDGEASIEAILDTSQRLYSVLTRIPQVLPFAQRVQIFHKLLQTDKRAVQDEAALYGHRIRVRRALIYEDSFAALNHLGRGLRGRVQVTFVSDLGTEEAGIDGGGVFKEFMDELTKRAFDPQYAIFRVTPDQLLYPNPLSELSIGEDHLRHFEFLGRVLAKALYESILVEPQFALFFLQRLAGKFNETDDLYSLDPELYRHLMSLKHIKRQGGNNDVSELSLNFEVVNQDDLRQTQTTAELIPNGRHVAVTNDNVFRYIQLVANYKLNIEINAQAQAFLRGFRDLIPMAWLKMFGAEELQILLTGEKRAIDVENLRAHTRYSGGYHPSQPIIQWFWEALRSFTPDQQSQFLMFVTSCSRQPLLGFQHLNPPLCIQRVPLTQGEGERLPSSATCMNLLKLPAYTSPQVLREKLLYAISSGAGFELS